MPQATQRSSKGEPVTDPLSCRRCGHDNAAGSNFCVSCGSPLSEIVDEPTEMLILGDVTTPPGPTSWLASSSVAVPRPGLGTSSTVVSPRWAVIPRARSFFDDITVSRRHAEAEFDGHTVTVRDVGSLNGTYLNQKQLDARRRSTMVTSSRSGSSS